MQGEAFEFDMAPGLYAIDIPKHPAEGTRGRHIEVRGVLDEAEWNRVASDILALTRPFMALHRMLGVVKRNHSAYVSTCNSWAVTGASTGSPVNEELLVEANAAALNFAASLHAFKDAAFHWVHADQAKTEALAGVYDKLRSESEDYNLWTRVRNYVTHRAPLYGAVSVSFREGRLACDPADVLGWDGWGGQLKAFLAAAPDLAERFLTASDAAALAISDFHDAALLLHGKEFETVGFEYVALCEKYGVEEIFGAMTIAEEMLPSYGPDVALLDVTGLERAFALLSELPNLPPQKKPRMTP